MKSLFFIDYLVICLILFLFVYLSLRGKTTTIGIFKTANKLPWFLASASLLIVYWNPTLDMINTRLVLEKGYSGLWFLKDILLTVGIAPVLFVPMWSRLNITTDNQLIPLRYSGRSARMLQVFRAIYVGIFISSFLCSFYILGIKKIISPYVDLSSYQFFFIFFLISLFLVFKNQLALKVKSDSLVALLYIVTMCLGIYYLIESFGGWVSIKEKLVTDHYQKLQLWPQSGQKSETQMNILAYMFIQWWSIRIMDQSNVNAQRYFAIRNPLGSFKAIFVPVIVIAITFAFSSFIWDAALLKQLSLEKGEASYVLLLSEALPVGFKGLLIITFVLGFITTYEAIVSWGASLVTIDILQDTKISKALGRGKVAYLSMLLIAILSILFALNSESLLDLTKLLFSVSIGVGPVFILRWFWWRINAWSQLSAMLSSGMYALSFDWYYRSYNPLWIENILLNYSISWYVFKLLRPL